MKSSYAVQRKSSGAGGGASTSASSPVESRKRPATIDEVVKIFRASPSAMRSKSSTLRRSARSSGDSENCPSSVRSRSHACRNWCSSQTTLFGCRTAYDGNFVAITASIGLPFASSRSSSRQRNACVRTRSPGYHLYGTVTSSVSCPCSRSACTSPSAKISVPPRSNGTCGMHTASLMGGRARARRPVVRARRRAGAARR